MSKTYKSYRLTEERPERAPKPNLRRAKDAERKEIEEALADRKKVVK